MKRFLVILMLLVMPLQVSWAAVAVYCQHDADLTTQHVGHHDHHHDHDVVDANASDANMDNGKLSKGSHGDCGVCHAHGSLAVARHLPSPVPIGMTFVPAHCVDFLPSFLVSQPERPKWARLA